MNPTAVGTRTEGIILAALLKMGKNVLLPFGGGARYDLAYEEDGKLVRVQCKTATYTRGCVIFNSRSIMRDGTHLGYGGDADYFGVYCVWLDKVYLVPVELVAKGKGSLRVEAARNGQAQGVVWAKDYEVL